MSRQLTTEIIRKKFKNNFDLCNFSITIARSAIQEGHSVSLGQVLEAAEHRANESLK